MNTSKSLLSVLMAFVLLFSSCASTKQTTTQPDLSTNNVYRTSTEEVQAVVGG